MYVVYIGSQYSLWTHGNKTENQLHGQKRRNFSELSWIWRQISLGETRQAKKQQ